MDFIYFVEGPLLWIAFLVLIGAIIIRLGFFVYRIAANSGGGRLRLGYIPATFGRLFVPFHMAVIKKPLYGVLRYVFHICLFVVPIWLSGHIVLWAGSRFGWDWTPLPDAWADSLTARSFEMASAAATVLSIMCCILSSVIEDEKPTTQIAAKKGPWLRIGAATAFTP